MGLWDSISTAVDKGWDQLQDTAAKDLADAKAVGVPALINTVASKGITVLTQVQQDAKAQTQAGVTNILNRPSDPDSWFNKILGPDISAAFEKNYGLYIVGGVLAIGAAGYFLMRKAN